MVWWKFRFSFLTYQNHILILLPTDLSTSHTKYRHKLHYGILPMMSKILLQHSTTWKRPWTYTLTTTLEQYVCGEGLEVQYQTRPYIHWRYKNRNQKLRQHHNHLKEGAQNIVQECHFGDWCWNSTQRKPVSSKFPCKMTHHSRRRQTNF